jgi:hypothetical protein
MVVGRRQMYTLRWLPWQAMAETESDLIWRGEGDRAERGGRHGVGLVHSRLDSQAGLHESASPSHRPWTSWASPL